MAARSPRLTSRSGRRTAAGLSKTRACRRTSKSSRRRPRSSRAAIRSSTKRSRSCSSNWRPIRSRRPHDLRTQQRRGRCRAYSFQFFLQLVEEKRHRGSLGGAMSRQIRLEFPGALYHVTQRGNNQQNIFLDDADRNVFLELLGESVERFAWILTSYVLMTNHFHFVIQLTCASLSVGMRWLDTEYPRYFNRRYGRVGHLYQRRFDGR